MGRDKDMKNKKYSSEYYTLKKKLSLVKQRDENLDFIEMYKECIIESKAYLAKQKKNTKDYFLAQKELEDEQHHLKWCISDLKKAKEDLAKMDKT